AGKRHRPGTIGVLPGHGKRRDAAAFRGCPRRGASRAPSKRATNYAMTTTGESTSLASSVVGLVWQPSRKRLLRSHGVGSFRTRAGLEDQMTGTRAMGPLWPLLLLALAAMSATTPAGAECKKDPRGDVVCGRGQCVVDVRGNVFCAKYRYGAIVK